MTRAARRKHPTPRQKICRRILEAAGWTIVDGIPDIPKYVLVVAPHTSNWDFFVGLLGAEAIDLERNWVGKHSLFRWPLGHVMKGLGGRPVDRSSPHEFVKQVIEIFEQSDRLVLSLAPEGTRSYTDHWKTGFYWIAHGAGVPIVLGYLDWSRKIAGLGPVIHPTGDIEADLERIRAFYADKRGRHPSKQSRIGLRRKT